MAKPKSGSEGKKYDGGEIPKMSPEDLEKAQAKAREERLEEAQAEAAERSEE